jgi:hypothetical protein
MTTFRCLRFETPPPWRDRSQYLYRPGTGWPSYIPRHRVPFPSPPTTRRAKVEVFKPASTWVQQQLKVKVKVKFRVRLGAKLLEDHDHRFFLATEPLRLKPLCNILSHERMGLSHMNRFGLCQMHVSCI